jgi:aminoglycoside 6'-N-acetyltransferase
VDADVELLVAWHADPEVSRFWDDETFTEAQIRERLRRRDVDAYIVELAGSAIGYVESWRDADGSSGLDMFLIPEARGAGYGPDAARTLATYLRDEGGWQRITVDPYLWNERAIRAWERAGFVRDAERPADEEHSSAWLLMVFDVKEGQTAKF